MRLLKKKKGFTLIELMIVIAMVAILAQVMIPKVGAVKVQMKNNSVQTNAKLVQAFLENRSGKDANSIKTYLYNHKDDFTGALSLIKTNLGTAMNNEFTLSNKITNPFNQSIIILSDQTSISLYGSTAASIVVGYDATDLPKDEAYVTSNLPQGSTFIGEVAVVIYKTGYVVYGIDDQGNKTDISIIKMPNGLVVGNITTPGTGTTPVTPTTTASVLNNIDIVYNFLAINAASKIIIGKSNSQQWKQLMNPFAGELTGYFVSNVPKTSPTYKAIENPMDTTYNNVIGPAWLDNNYLNNKYSVLALGNPISGWSVGNANPPLSNYKGTVVAAVNGVDQTAADQLGYDVFGIDGNGNKIGEKHLDMLTIMNATTESNLSNNVKNVSAYLKANLSIYSDKKNVMYNKIGTGGTDDYLMIDISNHFLNTSNSYVTSWQTIGYLEPYNFAPSYSVIVTKIAGDYSRFNGTVIILAIEGKGNTLGSFEVYNFQNAQLLDDAAFVFGRVGKRFQTKCLCMLTVVC